MRKFTLFLAALCCAITANAWEVVVDGIHYDLNLVTNDATVVREVDLFDDDNYLNLAGDITIPAWIRYDDENYYVIAIDHFAFCDAPNITSVTIANGIEEIGMFAFKYCSSLQHVTIQGNIPSIETGVFSCNPALVSVTLPDDLEEIGWYMFENCPALTTIKFPAHLVSLSSGAFEGCTSLTSVDLPDETALIYSGAFSGCTALKSVDLPASVALIGEEAFKGCSSLRTIKCRVASPVNIHQNVFQDVGCRNIELAVPNQSVNAYKANSVWGSFAVFPLNYDISFKVNGAVVYTFPKEFHTPAEDIKAEAKLVEQQMTIPAGKVFKHWNPEITDVTVSRAYEAVIEPAATITQCKIQFAVNGVPKTSFLLDEGSSKADVEYLASLFLDQVDMPADLEFKYWEPALAAVTDNQTYNAVFDYIDQNSYPISFVINGETVFTVNLKYGTEDWVVEGYANSVANGAVYPEGMTFKDWDKYFDKVTGPETYTARLRPIGEGIEEVSSSLQGGDRGRLILRNGVLYIERNGKTYNALGTEVQ